MSEISVNVEPRYGYYPWWPEDGDDWLHPEDVALARSMIPSMRVFRREGEQGPFVVLYYGDVKLRVLRTLWQEINSEGYELGDWVEVMSRCGQNEPRTGTIREIVWNERARALRYQILDNGKPIAKFFAADDIRPVEPTERKLDG